MNLFKEGISHRVARLKNEIKERYKEIGALKAMDDFVPEWIWDKVKSHESWVYPTFYIDLDKTFFYKMLKWARELEETGNYRLYFGEPGPSGDAPYISIGNRDEEQICFYFQIPRENPVCQKIQIGSRTEIREIPIYDYVCSDTVAELEAQHDQQ
jgi:hypothetical protein